jgi:ankyrin repeat protein
MMTKLEKQTPLHFAAKEGSVRIAECLISGFEVNKEPYDYYHRTPLYLAAEFSCFLIKFF